MLQSLIEQSIITAILAIFLIIVLALGMLFLVYRHDPRIKRIQAYGQIIFMIIFTIIVIFLTGTQTIALGEGLLILAILLIQLLFVDWSQFRKSDSVIDE